MKHDEGPGTPSRRRVVAFRVLAALTALLFLAAGLENALAGWMVISGASGDLHPEANRWFITTAGVADVTVAGSMLTLAWRPRAVALVLLLRGRLRRRCCHQPAVRARVRGDPRPDRPGAW